MRPYLTKTTIHYTLCGLAGGDENGKARPGPYIEALDDVRDELGIDVDEDSVRVQVKEIDE